MGFLPEDLELAAANVDTIPVTICQAEDDGPAFVVDIKQLPVKEYRKIFQKQQAQASGGFRASKNAADKSDKEYLEKVCAGGSGLTVANWEFIVKDGRGLTGDNIAVWRKEKKEIPVNQDVLFYLYRNTWPDDFGNKIFEVVQGNAAELEEDEDDLKNA